MKGFKLIKEEFISEINSEAILLEHEKTKARILKLKNEDKNKAFGIGFKTVQDKDNGICHILEHSVLSGSRKYKTKEPFMDLVKNSLQTFVNAMTFDDKTIYPLSSRNEKDFYNLMDVYLDSVFFPAIYKDKKILMQEGWHYELEDKDNPITINGVVYNEMKGAMSSDFAQAMTTLGRYLYKGSTYSTNSGGEPEFIPTLTEEELLHYHTEHYHPSNSYIYLYGDGDLEQELEHIAEFLDLFEYREPKEDMIPIKRLTETVKAESSYCGEEKEKNDFFIVSYLASDSKDNLNNIIHSVLEKALVLEDGAYIKDRIIREGLATEVETLFPVGEINNFSVISKGTDAKDKDKILAIIDEELERIAKEGLEEKELASIIHQMKYDVKTFGDSPHRGVLAYIRALQNWLFDSSPLEAFKYDEAFEKLEHNPALIQDYIKKYLRGHKVELVLRPDEKLFAKREEALREKLENFKNSLTDEELQTIIDETKELHDFQLREDTEEAKATIPSLNVGDLKKELEKTEMVIDQNISSVETFTNGVTYLDSVIPIGDMEDEKILQLSVVMDLIDKIDTENYTYKELSTEINILAYNFSSKFGLYKIAEKDEAFLALVKKLSAESKDLEAAIALYNEVHKTSVFKNVARIREILKSEISSLKLRAVMDGVSITVAEAVKNVNRSFEIHSLLDGVKSIKYLEELVAMEDAALVETLEKAYADYKELFDQKAFIHITGEKEDIEKAKALLEKAGKKTEQPCKKTFKLDYQKGNEQAIFALTDVNYCVDAAVLKEHKGSDKVVANLLSNTYLHNNIRAKGGAYGDGIVTQDDLTYLFSFRDPKIKETFDVYEHASQWLRDNKLEQKEIDNLIIGSYNAFDQNKTPKARSKTAFYRYLREVKHEKLEKRLQEALATSQEDIIDFANRLDEAMKNKGRAVFTSKEAYEKSKMNFKHIEEL